MFLFRYSQFKWKVASLFNNLLNFDAMTLGNHEFDDKIEGLLPFLKNQSCPVIVTNINITRAPELEGLILPSTILSVGGQNIGIVGFLTTDTKFVSNPGDTIEIYDEITALRTEIEALKRSNVNIIIAIGHSGYKKEIEIAQQLPDIDVIVGGHSHSFLYTETESKPNPSTNTIIGPYPTLVSHNENHKTLVVHAYAFTKYLGKVKVSFFCHKTQLTILFYRSN